MPIDPATCDAFPSREHEFARLVRRQRRGRALNLLVSAGTALVLAGLLAIPLYLLATLATGAAVAGIDWPAFGVLFAGSLRAAVCATLVALPLGFATAIHCAHFAAPRLRAWLKPGLEIMEALPSVVLGLVAAASFAGWLRGHVATVLAIIIALPCLLLAAGFACGRPTRHDGWLPLWLLPLVVAAVAIVVALSSRASAPVFVPASPWNAMLVGFALGLASVPIVFAIAEDALSQVPPSQRLAAAALGATRWQSLATIVLPAAASGLFAAGLLGFMRCFGETMIVLMASGNTAIGGFDPLTGLRSLAADITLGMPDAAPRSAGWRDLVVAALALVVFSLLSSVLARGMRERLRRRLRREADR